MDEDDPIEGYTNAVLDEARGGYIGPVSQDEAMDAIRRWSHGPVIVDYPEHGFANERTGGRTVRFRGWQEEMREGTGIFAFHGTDSVPLGSGVVYPDALVLDLGDSDWTAEQYTGGLDLRFACATVRLVFWASISHLTESGDIAPGLGPVHVARFAEHGED